MTDRVAVWVCLFAAIMLAAVLGTYLLLLLFRRLLDDPKDKDGTHE